MAISGLALSGCQDQIVHRAENAVKARLKDPDSAKFEGVAKCPFADGASGFVNSKNSYGGYVGRETFYYLDGEVRFVADGLGYVEFENRCTEPLTKLKEREEIEKNIERAGREAAAAVNTPDFANMTAEESAAVMDKLKHDMSIHDDAKMDEAADAIEAAADNVMEDTE